MNKIKIAGSLPIPNHSIANGIQLIGEIVLKSSINGLKARPRSLYHPSVSPIGIDKKTAKEKLSDTRVKLATECSSKAPLADKDNRL